MEDDWETEAEWESDTDEEEEEMGDDEENEENAIEVPINSPWFDPQTLVINVPLDDKASIKFDLWRVLDWLPSRHRHRTVNCAFSISTTKRKQKSAAAPKRKLNRTISHVTTATTTTTTTTTAKTTTTVAMMKERTALTTLITASSIARMIATKSSKTKSPALEVPPSIKTPFYRKAAMARNP